MGKKFGKILQGLGGAAESFASAFTGAYNRSSQIAQQNRMAKLHLDASLGIRGFEPMEDDEVADYMKSLKQKGFSAEGGMAMLPQGATYKDGIIYNAQGQQIGSYLKGAEPQALPTGEARKLHQGNVVNIAGNFYKYNPDLAKKMAGKFEEENTESIQDLIDELKKENPNLSGTWTPSSVYKSGAYFKYSPTIETQAMNIPEVAPALNTQPQPISAPQTLQQNAPPLQIATPQQFPPLKGKDDEKYPKMRIAVANAIKQGMPLEDIVAGLEEEGFSESDFADLLGVYNPKVPEVRRNLIGNFLMGIGLAPQYARNLLGQLSSQVEQRKKQLGTRAVIQ